MKKVSRVKLKPVSTNELHSISNSGGKLRKHNTEEYSNFLIAMQALLPSKSKVKVNPHGPLVIHYEFGIPKNMDGSNCVKATEDALATKYGFNDKNVIFHTVLKVPVKKGQEYIKFLIKPYKKGSWLSLTR